MTASDQATAEPGGETLHFQAEVSRLLDIVAHALYSDREVFLRELISNASDACDRHRYLAITEPEKAGETVPYRITLAPNAGERTLTISDTGIGMSRAELIENLGTIARSGTGKFVEELGAAAKGDDAPSLIGQFGVGFYAAFMVADKVEVTSRRAGSDEAFTWSSDGKGAFTVTPAARDGHGTTIVLHLKEDAAEFTEGYRLRSVVKKHSDHVGLPIVLVERDEDGGDKEETINSASALWTRSRSEITPELATQFYRDIAHATDDPFATIHVRAEGTLEYSALLFVPTSKPFDLFHPDRKHGVKLYARRVFITDDADLMPGYLRFVRGVVDSSDLPLNVSREMLQNNPVVPKIRSNVTRKVLAELEKLSGEAAYAAFWENFGAVIKEGLYEDYENREALLKLARFKSTAGDELVSLADYVGRMKPGQDAIYTISGEDPQALLGSPQLEGFRAKGIEVLLLTDPVDEFWVPSVGLFDGKEFKSVTRGSADLSKIEGGEDASKPEETPEQQGEIDTLVALVKLTLGDAVKDVRTSARLTDSAVCLVADEGDMDLRLEKLLRQHKQLEQVSKRVLELNPQHAVVKALAAKVAASGSGPQLTDAAWLLLDQARILEGEPVPDPRAFARRLDAALAAGFGGIAA